MAYPPIEPYETGVIDTGDGQHIYWKTCGNPDGKPALVVHGGPGSGCTPGMRKAFDPQRSPTARSSRTARSCATPAASPAFPVC